jgi:hypothetical protein
VRRDNDISAHPELKLARWAARELKREAAADHDVHQLSALRNVHRRHHALRLGRVVYALSTQQFTLLSPEPDWPSVAQEGPALFEEARVPIEEYYRL